MKLKKKQRKNWKLKTNHFGNVDGVPSGWIQTGFSPSKLAEYGVPYYMALTGFRLGRNGRVPITVPIIPKEYIRILNQRHSGNGKKPNKHLSVEQRQTAWAMRLDHFTGCGIPLAREIAQSKLKFKESQIGKLEDRQAEHYSKMRAQLIERIHKENPLRKITDIHHAHAIIQAYYRHTQTDYDQKLDEAREYAKYGLIDKKKVKWFARRAAERTENCADE